MKPGIATWLDFKLKPQGGKNSLIAFLTPLQLGPQGRLRHPVEVLAAVEQAKQLTRAPSDSRCEIEVIMISGSCRGDN
jgi:hypothetical protein